MGDKKEREDKTGFKWAGTRKKCEKQKKEGKGMRGSMDLDVDSEDDKSSGSSDDEKMMAVLSEKIKILDAQKSILDEKLARKQRRSEERKLAEKYVELEIEKMKEIEEIKNKYERKKEELKKDSIESGEIKTQEAEGAYQIFDMDEVGEDKEDKERKTVVLRAYMKGRMKIKIKSIQ